MNEVPDDLIHQAAISSLKNSLQYQEIVALTSITRKRKKGKKKK
jgi:hypothetical protein